MGLMTAAASMTETETSIIGGAPKTANISSRGLSAVKEQYSRVCGRADPDHPGQNVYPDGGQTLNENVADNGGVLSGLFAPSSKTRRPPVERAAIRGI